VKRAVLDASAILTFLLGRSGAEKIEELITLAITGKQLLFMSVVNWGEVYYSIWRTNGLQAAKQVAAEIGQFPIEIVDADIELTKIAAAFHAEFRLPYADCFAAALGKIKQAVVVTCDRDFALVKGPLNIQMI
jgi:predicted nucleic acid-binding protein